jgi:hypothetical protein
MSSARATMNISAGTICRLNPVHPVRFLFLTLIGITLIITAGCGQKNSSSDKGIKIRDISFPGSQMRPGTEKNSYVFTGRLKNKSNQHTVTEVRLLFTMSDVLDSGATTTVAERTIYIRREVPPGESGYFEEPVSFGSLPKPKGRHEWFYLVLEIKTKV